MRYDRADADTMRLLQRARLARVIPALAVALGLLGSGASGQVPSASPLRFVDAHSHVTRSISYDEEIARLRRTGMAAVIIMDPEPEALAEMVRRAPGFIIPFVSVARTPDAAGLRLDAQTVNAFARLLDAGAVCGFGEMPTRLSPNPDPDDATAFTNSFRQPIYALANARGMPVSTHVSLSSPATAAAVDRMASTYPNMMLILAHAGLDSEATVVERLLRRHRNIYADLSVRLDRPRPQEGGPGAITKIVAADGALDPRWRQLIERFPDRFLFGLDISEPGRGDRIAELTSAAEASIATLPRPVAEAVAGGNIQRLLKNCRWAQFPENPVVYAGTVVSVSDTDVTLRLRDGRVETVALLPDWIVGDPRKASVGDIRVGDYVASTQKDIAPGLGQASELRVFEPGYRPEQGTHGMPQAGVSMTHGSVAAIRHAANGERELILTYPEGRRRILVGASTPVNIYDRQDRKLVQPGTRVTAVTRRGPDGIQRAGRLTVASPAPGRE